MAAIAPLRASCVRPVRSRVLARTFHATASACGNKHLDWYFNAIREAEAAKHFVPPPVMPAQTLHGRKRARAYFDFKFGRDNDDPLQRVVFELADDLVPLAVQNFISVRFSNTSPRSAGLQLCFARPCSFVSAPLALATRAATSSWCARALAFWVATGF